MHVVQWQVGWSDDVMKDPMYVIDKLSIIITLYTVPYCALG